MKNTVKGFTLIACLASQASGFNISVANLVPADPTDVPIIDNVNAPIAQNTGFISAGVFSSDPLVNMVPDFSGFTEFGTGETTFAGAGFDGFFSVTRNLPLPEPADGVASDPLVGQDIFVVIGNGSTLETSSLFAIIDSGQQIGEDIAGAPEGEASILINDSFISESTLIFGEIQQDVPIEGLITFNEAIQLAPLNAIPEPSTSLLGLVAGLGLLARRRR